MRPGPGGEVVQRLLRPDGRALEPEQERGRGRVARPADEPLVEPRERRLAGRRQRDDRLHRGVVRGAGVEQRRGAVEQRGVREAVRRPRRGVLDGPDVLRVRPLPPPDGQALPAAPQQRAERRERGQRHPHHPAAAVAVVGVAVDRRQRDVAAPDDVAAAQQLAEQRLQRPGDRPVDQLGEQGRQRVRQLLDDARAHVERRGVGHRPVRRRRGRGLGQRRDRPGLHDRERAARPGPLHVLRRAEPLLDPHAERGQGGRLGVVEHGTGAVRGRNRPVFRALLDRDVCTALSAVVRDRIRPPRLLDDDVVRGHACRRRPPRRAPTPRRSRPRRGRPWWGSR